MDIPINLPEDQELDAKVSEIVFLDDENEEIGRIGDADQVPIPEVGSAVSFTNNWSVRDQEGEVVSDEHGRLVGGSGTASMLVQDVKYDYRYVYESEKLPELNLTSNEERVLKTVVIVTLKRN